MTSTESETVLTKIVTDTWSTPSQKRIEGFLATAALRLDSDLAEIDL